MSDKKTLVEGRRVAGSRGAKGSEGRRKEERLEIHKKQKMVRRDRTKSIN